MVNLHSSEGDKQVSRPTGSFASTGELFRHSATTGAIFRCENGARRFDSSGASRSMPPNPQYELEWQTRRTRIDTRLTDLGWEIVPFDPSRPIGSFTHH